MKDVSTLSKTNINRFMVITTGLDESKACRYTKSYLTIYGIKDLISHAECNSLRDLSYGLF